VFSISTEEQEQQGLWGVVRGKERGGLCAGAGRERKRGAKSHT